MSDSFLFLSEFLDHLRLRGASDATLKSYHSDLSLFFRHTGRSDPGKITAKEFADWDTYVRFKFHHNTRVRRRNSIRQFYRWLSENHGIEDVTAGLPALKRRESDPFLIFPEELEEILHAQDEDVPRQARDGALIAFLACTGVRRAETTALRMRNISLAPNGRQWIVEVPGLKPEFRTRRVNFGDLQAHADIASSHFGLWFVRRIRRDFGSTVAAANYPIWTPIDQPGHALAPQGIQDCVTRSVIRTGNPRLVEFPPVGEFMDFETGHKQPVCRVTPHTFRHYFATYCRVNGMALELIADYLGHRSIHTTQRYIHLAEKSTGEQMARFGPTRGLKAKPSLHADDFRDLFAKFIPRSS